MADDIIPKTLVLSCRSQNANLAASCFYEFEDLICDWMNADLLAPKDLRYNLRRKAQTLLYNFTKSQSLTRPLASPKLGPLSLEKKYDLIFATVPNMGSTYKLFDFKNLRENCELLACYVPEVWVKGLLENPFQVEPLKQCDHIFVSTEHSVETLQKMTGRPCTFLHFSVDALKFSAHPFFPTRHIDVMNIGRRSEETHAALIDAASTSDFYYVYDTINSIKFINAAEHRLYYANTAKRSKFYIANTANFDQDWKTGGAVEIGHRYYEGIASGAVVIGAYPTEHPVIQSDFDWPDAVIWEDFDAPRIVERLRALEDDHLRMDAVRRANMRNSALRHDFVYRWDQVLGLLGLTTTQKMADRIGALSDIGDGLKTSEEQIRGLEKPAHRMSI